MASNDSCGAGCDLVRHLLCMRFNFCELTLHVAFIYQCIPEIFQPGACNRQRRHGVNYIYMFTENKMVMQLEISFVSLI